MLDPYTTSLTRRNLSANTLRSYRTVVTAYMRAVDPVEATTAEIETWLDGRALRSPRSRSNYLAALTSFHRWMVSTGWRDGDPTANIARPKLPPRMPRPIATSDLVRALAAADPPMRLWLCLAAYGGLRCHEIAGLRVEDIDLEDAPATLRLRQTKGGKPRVVTVAGATLDALSVITLPESGQAFPGATARRVSDQINTFLRSQGTQATAHCLRHWFGTEVFRKTRNLRLVQELLGHADISTTAGYVALVPDDAAIRAVQGLTAG